MRNEAIIFSCKNPVSNPTGPKMVHAELNLQCRKTESQQCTVAIIASIISISIIITTTPPPPPPPAATIFVKPGGATRSSSRCAGGRVLPGMWQRHHAGNACYLECLLPRLRWVTNLWSSRDLLEASKVIVNISLFCIMLHALVFH